MKEFIFTWSIENISYSWHKTGEVIVSYPFFAGPLENTAWTLRLYPRGRLNSDFLSLYLQRETDRGPANIAINFELSCVSEDTTDIRKSLNPETFTVFGVGGMYGFGESCFASRHEVFDRRKALYLPHDTLTLRCRMWKDHKSNEFEQSFARTRLAIERILRVENIKPKVGMEEVFYIQTEPLGSGLMSISTLFHKDMLDMDIEVEDIKEMLFSTLKVSVVDKASNKKLCEHVSFWFGDLRNQVFRLPLTGLQKHRADDLRNLQKEAIDFDGGNFEFIAEVTYSTGEEMKTIQKNYQPSISGFVSKYITSHVPSGKLTDFPSISQDLWKMCKEQFLCNVELKTQEKSFFVHKLVLCVSSAVFRSMFSHDMMEQLSNCIEISDISSQTLEKFVKFLYTDDFKELEWNEALELYYESDKYQVDRLKLACQSYLMKNVNVENVSDLLILADRHTDSKLKLKVKHFIWKYEKKVFKSSTWQKFAYDHPNLVADCMLLTYEETENFYASEKDVEKSTVPTFMDDLRSNYGNYIDSDILIRTNDNIFNAHKVILCASSPVFRNMLMHSSAEFFELNDLEDDVVSIMLRFLYTESLGDAQLRTAMRLYRAAHKYEIHRLKFKCSCFLLENLRVSNACDLFLLAHNHGDVKFKSLVSEYIVRYDEEVFGSDQWADFCEKHSSHAVEIMCAKYRKSSNTY